MIETDRLILREYRKEDFERVHSYGSIPEFSQYDAWGPNTEEDTHKFIEVMISRSQKQPRYEFEYAVCLKEENLLIGGSGIRRECEGSRVANLGYGIHPDYQGKGYASEATKGLIDFGFEKLGLTVIYATCDTRNTASFKVMEKVGMIKVGQIKDHLEIKGHMRDSFRYEIYPS